MHSGSCAGCSVLTLARTPEGWVQRSAFRHPDMHDEFVEEPLSKVSPFTAVMPFTSDVIAFRFLLLGDQNSGKSTFLHAFTHAADESWLELVSILPILSSTFLNAQLLPAGSLAG